MTAATPTSPVTSFGVPTRPEARVFHQVRCLHPADRRRIQTTLGLSQPSVTRHVAALIDAGFVEEAPARDTQSVGRPRKQLLVDGRHLTVWGAHIGVRNSVLTVADAGGRILVQDAESSVVWGMPGAVANAGLADAVLPLEELAGRITSAVRAVPARV